MIDSLRRPLPVSLMAEQPRAPPACFEGALLGLKTFQCVCVCVSGVETLEGGGRDLPPTR